MILVTGAAGLSGSAVVRELSRRGVGVRALVRSKQRAQALEQLPGVEVVEGDLARAATLGAALDGIERALLISSSDEQMVETQSAFIDAAKHAGVPHVIKFSGRESNLGFDQSAFRFMRMHVEAERYLEGSGLAWTHIQPSQFMQVYLREARTISAQQALFLPMAEGTLAPVDVEDIAIIAASIVAGGNHAGKSYPVTGPQALTMTDVAHAISDALHTPIRYVPISAQARLEAMLAGGVPPYAAAALDEQNTERLRHPQAGVDTTTHATFGVRPTTFAEFAVRNAAAFGIPAVR